MLVLTRKLMERLYIGDEICVTVVRLEGGQVRLGIDAPRHISVVRAELVPERDDEESERTARVQRPRPTHAPLNANARPRRTASKSDRDRRRTALLKSVTDAADRLDEVRAVSQLLAQAFDVDVDGPFQDHRVLADRRVHQLVTGERPPRLTQQNLQEPKLRRRQRQLDLAIRRAVPMPIDDHSLTLHHRAGRAVVLLPPPRNSFLIRWIKTFILYGLVT